MGQGFQGPLHRKIPHLPRQGQGLVLGLTTAEHLPDKRVLPGKQAVFQGNGRVLGELLPQDHRLPLGVAQGAGGILKQGEGKPLVQHRQGKIKVGPSNVDL